MSDFPQYNPAMQHRKAFQAIVIDDGERSLDIISWTEQERHDLVLDSLSSNHDEVTDEEVASALAEHPGNPEAALEQVIALYADFGADVYLSWMHVPVGPKALHTVFTDYGNGTSAIEHFDTASARLNSLRTRAGAFLDETEPIEVLDNADEETCRRVLERAVVSTRGSVSLYTAEFRQDGSWIGVVS